MVTRVLLREARLFQAVVVITLFWTRHVLAAVYPGLPATGSVFIGSFTCNTVSRGVRFTYTAWPTQALFEYFPTTGAPNTFPSNCTGKYDMSLLGSFEYGELSLMNPIVGSLNGTCQEPEVGFQATLQSDNMTLTGNMLAAGCGNGKVISMVRQIGYEIRTPAQFATFLPCTDQSTAFQSSRAVFRTCPPNTTGCEPGVCSCQPGSPGCMKQEGATEVTMPGDSDIKAFTIPPGTSNVVLKLQGVTNDVPLGLTLVPDGNTSLQRTMWFMLINQDQDRLQPLNGALLSVGQGITTTEKILNIGQVTLNCSKIDDNTVGGTCILTPSIIPQRVQVYVSLKYDQTAQQEWAGQVSYSFYMWENCTDVYPISASLIDECQYGCCPKNIEVSETAVQVWARLQREKGWTNSSAAMEVYGLSSTEAGIPFYRWQAAYNKGVGGWDTDWSPHWAETFFYLDTNEDGLISEGEYYAGFNVQVGRCPTGYIQTHPLVMSCDSVTDSVSFSLKDLPGNNSVLLPVGVRNVFLRVEAPVSIDLRIRRDNGLSVQYIVYGDGPDEEVVVNKNKLTGTWGGVDITYAYGTESDGTNYASVTMSGTLSQSVLALANYDVIAENAVAPGNLDNWDMGFYSYSTTGVEPANCTSNIYENACTAYNITAANVAVQVWSSYLQLSFATAAAAWETTLNFRLRDKEAKLPYIPWGFFNQYWYTVFITYRRLNDGEGKYDGRRLSEEAEARGRRLSDYGQTLRGSSLQAFRYADSNNDGYVSEAEFNAIYTSVLSCGTKEYQAAMMLLGCAGPKSATTLLTVETGVSLPIVIVPPGMTGMTLTASSTIDMSLTFESTDMAASPDINYNTKSPTSTASTVASTDASSPGSFSVNIVTTSASTKTIQLNFQGTTLGSTTWLISNNGTSTGSVTFSYSFSNLTTCTAAASVLPTTNVSGCLPYNNTLAQEFTLAWSQRVSGIGGYDTSDEAWAGFSPQKVLFGNIPQSTFPKVWCNSTQLAAGCPNWLIGFKAMDSNDDMTVSINEVTVAYSQASAASLSVSALTDGCSIATRYTLADFPIPMMRNFESCHCSTKLAEGWDKDTSLCMKRRQTTCNSCDFQPRCAKITTSVGNGLQEFLGDCPSAVSQGQCSGATDASFAYPSAIAVDEDDNIYISDHGNNRIRMVHTETQLVVTIAGTGQLGFGGDGGDGKFAQLRHPEGIAVNSLTAPASFGAASCTSQSRVVYFSDFNNQRVRSLTKVGDAWIIDTVLGTGERGENPACDLGCPAAEAILNLPRALALTRWGDLYIVDSGNRKVKLLSNGVMSTFLGSGSTYASINVLAMRNKNGELLSGSWQEDNFDVYLNSIYAIQLDKEDNLWVVDGLQNRLLRAPLHNETLTHTRGYIGRYLFYFQLHYGQLKDIDEMTTNMAEWLAYETVDGAALYTPPLIKLSRGERIINKTSWVYANPEPGNWCDPTTRPDLCLKSDAQFTKFRRIMGLCFDAGNVLFAVDQIASQVMTISEDPVIKAPTTDLNLLSSQTIGNCPCLQYSVDWLAHGRDPTSSNFVEYSRQISLQLEEMCTDNPTFQSNIPDFLKVPCSITNYCSYSATSPTCYINTTNMPHNSLCKTSSWGYCEQEASPEINFKAIQQTSILGNEIRRTSRCTGKKSRILGQASGTSLEDLIFSWGEMQISQGFQCDDTLYVYPWTMLLGFEEPQQVSSAPNQPWSQPLRPSDCSYPCCGLQNVTDDISTYCAINNFDDYQIFLKYVNGLNSTDPDVAALTSQPNPIKELLNSIAKEWYGVVLVWSALQTAAKTSFECAEACMFDWKCKAFVVQPYRDGLVTSSSTYDYACTTYSETWPYSIYIYNTSRSPPSWNVNPTHVYTRLFNFDSANAGSDPNGIYNAYVNTFTSTQPEGYLSGPHSDRALAFELCQSLCGNTTNCTSIAFPGCYLFSHPPSYWESITQSASDTTKQTTVYVKSQISVQVSGVTGSPTVYAYSDDSESNHRAVPALVNKPTACALDSSGNVLIADTWNHRIRKVSQLQVGCQYNMDLFTKEEVADYRDKVNNMDTLCFNSSLAPFAADRQTLQYGLLQNLAQSSIDLLCSAPDAVVADGIDTKNLMVLCDVCSEFNPRPVVCPDVNLCTCRTSIVRVLATKVYLNCPTQSAYYEKWHKFLSGYAACWMLASPKDAQFLGVARQNLVDAICGDAAQEQCQTCGLGPNCR